MKLRKCSCGGIPKFNGYVLKCNSCGTSTHCYMNVALAIDDWNNERGLIIRHPLKLNGYRVNREQAEKILQQEYV